jgi:hypothetical protein
MSCSVTCALKLWRVFGSVHAPPSFLSLPHHVFGSVFSTSISRLYAAKCLTVTLALR